MCSIGNRLATRLMVAGAVDGSPIEPAPLLADYVCVSGTSTPRPRRRSAGSAGDALPVYSGRFGAAHAERLLWRAGFGPRRGQAARLARNGLRAAVLSLTRP